MTSRVASRVIPRTILASGGCLLLLASATVAQVAWREAPLVASRSDHGMAYDSARGRTVVFGGYIGGPSYPIDTLEWDGTRWLQRLSAHSPSGRTSPALAYDAARQRVVLFGGRFGGCSEFCDDTWEWDGADWQQRLPATTPPRRSGHRLVYDAARQRVVMFGGFAYGVGLQADTWEWDGNDWTLRATSGPSGRSNFGMAYDTIRQRVVLFGGYEFSQSLGDTWEWDGTRWLNRHPKWAPSARFDQRLAFDSMRGRVVLFGGRSGSNRYTDTWEWDGSIWTARPANPRPKAFFRFDLAYDSRLGRTVVFGGEDDFGRLAETWEWDGVGWVQRAINGNPPAALGKTMTYDSQRERAVLLLADSFGRGGQTWEWDGSAWQERQPSQNPGGRSGHIMTYDAARGRVVVFGGVAPASGWLNDTWEWDGVAWAQRSPATRPLPRGGAIATYDARRDRVVMFGGLVNFGSTGSYVSETWEYDGVDWVQRASSGPSPRGEAGFAYDAARGRCVLFGGCAGDPHYADTWEWDGSAWAQRQPANRPSPRCTTLVYDTARRRVVLYGGVFSWSHGRSDYSDTWEWDGTDWIQRNFGPQPGLTRALVYDVARSQVVLSAATTWTYGPVNPASFEALGSGCAGRRGGPTLQPVPGDLPWLGEPFRVEIGNLPTASPTALFLGFSKTQWGQIGLPFDLGLLGMPGCSLFVSPEFVFPLANTGGTATFSLTVPNDANLVSLDFYQQGKVIDTGANALGVIVSNAGEGKIGAK